jgi:hypothetical protein
LALAVFLVEEGFGEEASDQRLNKLSSLCIIFGVLLQLTVFAESGISKLRRVSLIWLVIALTLASSTTILFLDLTAVFFAGFLFSFLPREQPVTTD